MTSSTTKTSPFRLEYNGSHFRRNYGEHSPWSEEWGTVIRECDLDTYFAFMQWMDDHRPDGCTYLEVLAEWECFAQTFGKRTFAPSRTWTPDKGDFREWMDG